MNRVVRTTVATAGLLAAGIAVNPTQAQAADGRVGERMTVCAVDLEVRTAPVGARLGTLHNPETFLVERVEGTWVYGFAYGHINTRGWVQNGWFC